MARIIALLLLAVAFAPQPATAHSHRKRGLEIVHPWTPAMLEAGIRNVPVYMKLRSRSHQADRLLRATTPLGEKVELIDLQSVGSVKVPMPVAAIDIPAGRVRELTADGQRLLIIGIKRRLHAYDSFPLTLVFEKAGRIVVEVAVEDAGTTEPHKH